MSSISRIEKILKQLARQHAPQLLSVDWDQQPNALTNLASGLAHNGVLVLMAHVPREENIVIRDHYIQNWVGNYIGLYQTIVNAVFPHHTSLDVEYADPNHPVVVRLIGQNLYVTSIIADYVVPFVVHFQGSQKPSNLEIYGLVTTILDGIGCDYEDSRCSKLSSELVKIINNLTILKVRQVGLTKPSDEPVKHINLQNKDTLTIAEMDSQPFNSQFTDDELLNIIKNAKPFNRNSQNALRELRDRNYKLSKMLNDIIMSLSITKSANIVSIDKLNETRYNRSTIPLNQKPFEVETRPMRPPSRDEDDLYKSNM